MKSLMVLVIIISTAINPIYCQYSISGTVKDNRTDKPIGFASVLHSDNELWVIADVKGGFTIKNIPAGRNEITVRCLGYVQKAFVVEVTGNISNFVFALSEENLAISEVVVVAQKKSDASTSYTISETMLEHMQLQNVVEIASLLPGGQTSRTLHMATTSGQRFALRSSTSDKLSAASFGTAVEVDGIRLSNNASMSAMEGVDTRNIASTNIESVEVITGIPSVEYGDISNGIVKINLRKGKSPFIIDLATKPNIKQLAISKGFELRHGVLNINMERTKSISQLASPYTSYDRNSLSLNYYNSFDVNNGQSIMLSAGVTGNIGGYDSKADPDAFANTYNKIRDNTLRSNMSVNWQLNKPWITTVDLTATAVFSDKIIKTSSYKSSATSVVAIHGKQEGYFVANKYEDGPDAHILMIPPGYWYEIGYTDDKPVDITAKLKVRLVRRYGRMLNTFTVGGDFSTSGNNGRGAYYDDMRLAPTWRAYPYNIVPYMNNYAIYAQYKANIRIKGDTKLQIIAGLRAEYTSVEGSDYGTASSLSPRFNASYTLIDSRRGNTVDKLILKAGWGKAVKLPSLSVLYPAPTYTDRLAFAPGSMADGSIYYAYNTTPNKPVYNPQLRWQSNRQAEAGIDIRIKGVSISLTAYRNIVYNAYTSTRLYTPAAYKLTVPSALDGIEIPSADRQYSIDQSSGIVTVHDKTGVYQPQQLQYIEKQTFRSNSTYVNDSPVERKGVEWIVDFGRIGAINTSVRLDGNYYHYKAVKENLVEQVASQNMTDGTPYRYVGIYAGAAAVSNGNRSKMLTSNLTLTSHIPSVRLIISLRIEGCFVNYSRNLSEYQGRQLGFVLDTPSDYLPSATKNNIYAGDTYVGLYPLYYYSYDDVYTKIPFAEKFAWAKDNDPVLYADLSNLVQKSNTNYYFNKQYTSAYFCANISVTKEIGNRASISFNAINFTNNSGNIHLSWNKNDYSLYDSSYIPQFYYGLSLKLKL